MSPEFGDVSPQGVEIAMHEPAVSVSTMGHHGWSNILPSGPPIARLSWIQVSALLELSSAPSPTVVNGGGIVNRLTSKARDG